MQRLCNMIKMIKHLHVLSSHHPAWKPVLHSYLWCLVTLGLTSVVSTITDVLCVSTLGATIYTMLVSFGYSHDGMFSNTLQ